MDVREVPRALNAVNLRSEQRHKPCLLKVMVGRQCVLQSSLLHDYERNAVG